jgi:hypothetical protein
MRTKLPERKAILLRLPPELAAEVEAAAAADCRSVNAELTVLIRAALAARRAGRRKGGER